MADYKNRTLKGSRNPWVSDYWQQKARKEGYPARSVYKLMEIDEKFGLLKTPNVRVLDIGAAPGSWSLYVLQKMALKGKGFLTAVDLSPLPNKFDNDNFLFIQGDITTQDVRTSLLSKGPFNVIISDAAPNTTGNHMVDSARSVELVEAVFSYAEDALSSGGNLAVKVFQGSGTDALLKHMKTLFTTAKSFKPQACRGESVETYFVGLGRRK
ncbi:MAG: RlmE family RNA methyltransferase [Treponema sp.]|nr:RlmE family RNA methyltransferase [Treponema sp.]